MSSICIQASHDTTTSRPTAVENSPATAHFSGGSSSTSSIHSPSSLTTSFLSHVKVNVLDLKSAPGNLPTSASVSVMNRRLTSNNNDRREEDNSMSDLSPKRGELPDDTMKHVGDRPADVIHPPSNIDCDTCNDDDATELISTTETEHEESAVIKVERSIIDEHESQLDVNSMVKVEITEDLSCEDQLASLSKTSSPPSLASTNDLKESHGVNHSPHPPPSEMNNVYQIFEHFIKQNNNLISIGEVVGVNEDTFESDTCTQQLKLPMIPLSIKCAWLIPRFDVSKDGKPCFKVFTKLDSIEPIMPEELIHQQTATSIMTQQQTNVPNDKDGHLIGNEREPVHQIDSRHSPLDLTKSLTSPLAQHETPAGVKSDSTMSNIQKGVMNSEIAALLNVSTSPPQKSALSDANFIELANKIFQQRLQNDVNNEKNCSTQTTLGESTFTNQSRCEECNINFNKIQNFIAHKKYYCSAKSNSESSGNKSPNKIQNPKSNPSTSPVNIDVSQVVANQHQKLSPSNSIRTNQISPKTSSCKQQQLTSPNASSRGPATENDKATAFTAMKLLSPTTDSALRSISNSSPLLPKDQEELIRLMCGWKRKSPSGGSHQLPSPPLIQPQNVENGSLGYKRRRRYPPLVPSTSTTCLQTTNKNSKRCSEPKMAPVVIPNSNTISHKCDGCGIQFKSLINLQAHQARYCTGKRSSSLDSPQIVVPGVTAADPPPTRLATTRNEISVNNNAASSKGADSQNMLKNLIQTIMKVATANNETLSEEPSINTTSTNQSQQENQLLSLMNSMTMLKEKMQKQTNNDDTNIKSAASCKKDDMDIKVEKEEIGGNSTSEESTRKSPTAEISCILCGYKDTSVEALKVHINNHFELEKKRLQIETERGDVENVDRKQVGQIAPKSGLISNRVTVAPEFKKETQGDDVPQGSESGSFAECKSTKLHCVPCDISFSQSSNYIAHKKFYCKSSKCQPDE